MSTLIALCPLLMIGASGAAQDEPSVETYAVPREKHIPISLMLFPTLGTDGELRDEPTVKNVSLALAAGYAWRIEGLDLSFGLAWTEREVAGIQLGSAGLVEGDMLGIQLTGSVGYAGGYLHGFQASPLATYAGGEVHGFQAAAWVTYAGGEMHGFQGAGLVTMAAGETSGFQGAGLANWAGADGGGFQGAGIFNYVERRMGGIQAAGVANFATELRGLQVATVNVAGHAVGAQIGVVNIGRRSDGLTLGILNLIDEGIHGVSLFTSDVAATNVALSLGGTHTYTIFTAGVAPYANASGWLAGGGLGIRGAIDDYELDLAGLMRMVRTDFGGDLDTRTTGALVTAQLTFGIRFFDAVKVFGGPSFNFYFTERARRDDPFIPSFATRVADGEQPYLWPGFIAGVELSRLL